MEVEKHRVKLHALDAFTEQRTPEQVAAVHGDAPCGFLCRACNVVAIPATDDRRAFTQAFHDFMNAHEAHEVWLACETKKGEFLTVRRLHRKN